MSAWAQLLERSALAMGTAWEHLMSPAPVAPGAGVVLNEGVCIVIDAQPLAIALADHPLAVLALPPPLVVLVSSPPDIVLAPSSLSSQATP